MSDNAADVSTKRRVVAVIDGNSLLHRAFHAIPPTMTAPDGRPTGALFGFLSMFLKLVETLHPYGVVCAFDKGKPQRRIDILPQYKAQRPPTDPLLKAQFPMVRELVAAMGVPVYEAQGWEGDDILGTLAAQGEAAGCDMMLVTGDRDAYQLASEHVSIVNTKKGLSDVEIFDPAGVEALYDGITPALVPDFYGLKGDTSDNIPGVPGIGPKKASALIAQYGSLDAVLEHADEVKGKMGENLRAHKEDALVSRRIATIERTAPVTLDVEGSVWPSFDVAVLKRHLDTLGFTSLARRVLAYSPAASLSAAVPDAAASQDLALDPALPSEPVTGEEAWESLRQAVQAGDWLGIVASSAGEGSLFALDEGFKLHIALTSGWEVTDPGHAGARDGSGGAVPAQGHAAASPARVLRFDSDAAEALALAVEKGRVCAYDLKSVLHRLVPVDSNEPALIDLALVDPARTFDAGLAGYLLDSNRNDYGCAALMGMYLPFGLPEVQPDTPHADDVDLAAATALLVLREVLDARMDADQCRACYDDIEMPLVPVLVALERAGMTVGLDKLRGLSTQLGAQIDEITARIYAQAGEPFNIGSPMQLAHVLFDEDKLALPSKGLKKTKSGYYSTNAKVLEELAEEYEIVADVLEYRERAKIKSTYLDALPLQAQRESDGKVHTSYNQTVTATGRLSSSDPNLQNIPIRSELGRMVREAFVPADPEGSCILGCDYSQIELRLLAHLSGDPGLIAAFTQGEDFHRETAARVFGIDPDQVTPSQRSRAKAVNFGIVYGQQAYGLSTSLKISFAEAQDMIDRYFIQFPQVRRYLDSLVDQAHAQGWVETMFGRRRYVPDVFSRNPNLRSFGERTAMNHPMQGSAADIIKIAMARVQRRMDREGFRAKMIVQVHDELDFDCPNDEVEALSSLVREEMTGVVELKVPLLVSCESGPTWAQAH